MSEKITINLNIFDECGIQVDTTTSELTAEEISDIIDHASQLAIIFKEKGKVDEDVLAELIEALEVSEVI